MISIANNLELCVGVLLKLIASAMILGSLVGAISFVVGSFKH